MPLEMDPNATRIFQPYKIYGALNLLGVHLRIILPMVLG